MLSGCAATSPWVAVTALCDVFADKIKTVCLYNKPEGEVWSVTGGLTLNSAAGMMPALFNRNDSRAWLTRREITALRFR
jgi:hypothetical protein